MLNSSGGCDESDPRTPASARLGIVCDVGGTILLTDELHRRAWREALVEHDACDDERIRKAYAGLAQGLDSFATANSLGLSHEQAEELALTKQRLAQVPRRSRVNEQTLAWLRSQTNAHVVAISHSDEGWTRAMLQLAGVLEVFVLVRGRTRGRQVPKVVLLEDALTILNQRWAVDQLLYCGDTEYDRRIAADADVAYVDACEL